MLVRKHMEDFIKNYVRFPKDDRKNVSDKFQELEKRIKEDKRHLGVIIKIGKFEVI